MKKLTCLLLALILLIPCFAVLAEGETETYAEPILFRGIPWGTSMSEAIAQISNDLSFDVDAYTVSYRIDNMLYKFNSEGAIYDGEKLTYRYIANSSALSKIGGMKVAGYPLRQLILFGVSQPNDKGSLAKDRDHISLFYGAYYFDVTQTDAVYADLLSKLTSLYGDVDLNREEDGVVQNLWRGAEGSMVSLVNNDGSIMIRYGFSGADELIEQAHQVLNYGEVILAGDSTDGL